MNKKFWTFLLFFSTLLLTWSPTTSEDDVINTETDEYLEVEEDIGKATEASRTDDDVIKREEESIHLDGLSPSEIKMLREQSEKHIFHAEVNRMMKLIINSLYRNKEIFLREIISNASDALDKIRILSLTDESILTATSEMSIKIKIDSENDVLHITDTGIGMTKADLVQNLGTIAKSGTSDFFERMSNASSEESMSDLIGQFGVGFYSAFLVADKVIVTSKHNDDSQHIWESDSESFSVVADPRGNTLGRGTTVSLYMKQEASDFLELSTIKSLIQKYSQFINFPIYLWSNKTVNEEVPIEENEGEEDVLKEKKDDLEEDVLKEKKDDLEDEIDEVEVEEEIEEQKPKTKTIQKTVWDWELINETKPIWQRPPKEIKDEEYDAFFKAITKEHAVPMIKTHFTAEGEISFKSILFVPSKAPPRMLEDYGRKKSDNIKMYVRRVFITDEFPDMMPKYLEFIRGVVDSDDLPLNVSRENLQQHKLLKVIKKKLVRKALDMIKKIEPEVYIENFWKEFGTNIKIGVVEDQSNRTRLSKLLRFSSSNDPEGLTSLSDYVERMKEDQEKIYYCGGISLKEDNAKNLKLGETVKQLTKILSEMPRRCCPIKVQNSPFVERLLKKGYEILYLTEAIDEYTVQAMPEYDGKRFQNVAKEGLGLDDGKKAKERKEAFEKKFEPLATWLQETAFKDKIEKAVITERLLDSPCALVASQYGWSGNMERIMKAQTYQDQKNWSADFYTKQKKVLEINPRHPLIITLLEKIEADPEDAQAEEIAKVMFDTAVLRSGYTIEDSVKFSTRILNMLYSTLSIDSSIQVEEEPEYEEEEEEDIEVEKEEAIPSENESFVDAEIEELKFNTESSHELQPEEAHDEL